jgi:hypothetical protein
MRDQLAQLEAGIETFADNEPDEADERTYDNVQAASLSGVGGRGGPPPSVVVCDRKQATGVMVSVQRLAREVRAMTDGTGHADHLR